jgi:transposase
MSERAAARHFGISRESVKKMLSFSAPPGYRRTASIKRPKLDGFTAIIDQWLREDLGRLKKQRHTAKRVFERLRDEHGFSGGYTIVKDYVREHQRRRREMFVPLHHPPGHTQADFGEALVEIGGVEQKAHFFALDLPHSDACYIRAYPAATAEAWMDGHVHAFAFFGRVPQSVLYDNDRCLVARMRPAMMAVLPVLDCSVQNTWTKSEHASFCISHLYVLNFFLALCRSQPHLPSTAVQSRVWLVISGANGHERAVRGSGQPDLS